MKNMQKLLQQIVIDIITTGYRLDQHKNIKPVVRRIGTKNGIRAFRHFGNWYCLTLHTTLRSWLDFLKEFRGALTTDIFGEDIFLEQMRTKIYH